MLLRAASDVRTAVAATAFTQTGWASAQEIAQRVDLPRTVATLQLALVGSVDVAYVVRDLAAINQGCAVSKRAVALSSQQEAGPAADPGRPRHEAAASGTPATVPANQLIPSPKPIRQGLINLADEVIDSTNKAVAAGAGITPSGPDHRDKPPCKRSGRLPETRDVPRKNPNMGGPKR